MKLTLSAEMALPEGTDTFHLAKTALIAEDGALWGVVNVEVDGEWEVRIVRADATGLTHHALSGPEVDDVFSAQTLIDLGDGTVAVVLSTGALRILDTSCSIVADLTIDGEESLRERGLKIAPSTARGRSGLGYVLRLGSRFGARTLVPLRVDTAARSATWGEAIVLDDTTYPTDRYGSDDFEGNDAPASPIIGDVFAAGESIIVCTEGSSESVLKYGMDFFTVDRLNTDGALAERVLEQSGWKRMPGKHGWTGHITSDADAVILTPVFASGEWKGKQRVLHLADGALSPITLPRGASKSTVLDVRDGRAWVTDGRERLLLCDL